MPSAFQSQKHKLPVAPRPRSLRGLAPLCAEAMVSNLIDLIAMASNLIAMASNSIAMASNLIAMASNLVAMASNLIAMASNPNSDGLQPSSDGLQPNSDGLQPTRDCILLAERLLPGSGGGRGAVCRYRKRPRVKNYAQRREPRAGRP